jgi:hypothetical protein
MREKIVAPQKMGNPAMLIQNTDFIAYLLSAVRTNWKEILSCHAFLAQWNIFGKL